MKILKVVDTREYEEVADGKWAPIPGSGNARECDRCGRAHEVHAYVETPTGDAMVVGTGCMGLGPDVARRIASKASTLARLTAEREHLADLLVAREVARREAAKLTPPAPEYVVKPWGAAVSVGGYDAVYRNTSGGFTVRSEAEAVAEATRGWRESMVAELARTPLHEATLRQRLDAVDRRLRKVQAS